MADELSDLRLFTRIVAAGSLSETARRANASLAAVSRGLSGLEDRLGVRLIDRGSRKFTPTEEGLLLHERAVPIMEALAGRGKISLVGSDHWLEAALENVSTSRGFVRRCTRRSLVVYPAGQASSLGSLIRL